MAVDLIMRGVLLMALSGLTAAQSVPDPTLPYTFDSPYQQEAKGNGLAMEKPNIIIFMPDQLRYDSVGVFGSDVGFLPLTYGNG